MLEDISDLSGHKTPHGKVRQVIPAEAVEAAAKLLYVEDHLWDEPWETVSRHIRERYQARALVALDAALPRLLSHEREQTRLAHLDAMVNRETKLEELAEAWARGHHDGAVDQMLNMENGGAKTTPNPYMLNNEGEK